MKTPEEVLGHNVAEITAAALAACGCATVDDALKIIDEVLELAQLWQTGAIPLAEVRRLTSPEDRYLAARFVRPMPASLAALLDALIATNVDADGGGLYQTKHGGITEAEMRGALTKHDQQDGVIRYRFPQRQPWLKYPDPGGKTPQERDGIRGDPYYATDQKDRIRVANTFIGDHWMGDGPQKGTKKRRLLSWKDE